MTEDGPDDVADVLIDAIHGRRLVEVVSDPRSAGLDPDDPMVAAAVTATMSVGASARRHAERVRTAMDEGRVVASVAEPDERLQLASIAVTVDRGHVESARRALEGAGYAPVRRLSPGAWRAVVRWSSSFLFAAGDGSSAQVELCWAEKIATPTRLRRAIAPAGPQLSRVDLPAVAWPLYSLVRVSDLATRTVRRRSKDRDLGPHLPTPGALVDPLLDLAEVGSDDVLLDVGSGDGRVVIAAAQSRSCRGLGVELDAELDESARRAAVASGVAERVDFYCGDVVDADLSAVTVAFVFLPARALASVIGGLQGALPPGARIVAHELDRLVGVPVPDRSVPVFADGAISVGHRWTV